ncbi:MAG: thioesterase [Rhodothermales bacterium]|nr:thioesterase [Rhodothermales bacterium]
MPTYSPIWTESFEVRTFETDAGGHVSFLALCNYFQEAAGKHAHSYGVAVDQLLPEGKTWVLARLHICIDAYPDWTDVVTVETWPSGVQGLFAIREFQFHSGGAVIGYGTSAWLVIDLNRRRPVRVEQLLSHVAPPDRPRTIEDAFPRLPVPERVDHARSFHVRYSDLDLNQHVNNVRFAEWAFESVPDEVLHGAVLREIELQYRAEATFGDLVMVEAQCTNGADAPRFRHRLVRDADGRDLAVARTRWSPRAGAAE